MGSVADHVTTGIVLMEYLIKYDLLYHYITYYIRYIMRAHLKKTIILLLFLRLQHETGPFHFLLVTIKLGLFVFKKKNPNIK